TARSARLSPPSSTAKLARNGGPMHQVSSSCDGTSRSSFRSAYWIEPVMPGLGSVSVPSRSKNRVGSVGIAGRQVARNLRALVDIAADRDHRRRRAGPVGLLEAVISTVEARDHAGATVPGRRFSVEQRLHLVAPFGAFIAAADPAQIMQRAEDLGEPLQVAVERRGGVLSAGRAAKAGKYGE